MIDRIMHEYYDIHVVQADYYLTRHNCTSHMWYYEWLYEYPPTCIS